MRHMRLRDDPYDFSKHVAPKTAEDSKSAAKPGCSAGRFVLTEYRCPGCGKIVMQPKPWKKWKALVCTLCGGRRFQRIAEA
jgi:DNA-directed RNA polymerase subunit RPC12/RpoP